MNFELRIKALEAKGETPGTTLGRTITEKGMGWVLAIGDMGRPKTFYYGDTIEEVLLAAEEAARK